MKGKLSCVVVIVGLVLATHSQSSSSQREGLEGSPDVYVSSQLDVREQIYLGLIDEIWLKTKVELACRESGIPLVEDGEVPNTMIHLDILLHVNQLTSDRKPFDFYSYTLFLRVSDEVLLYRSILEEKLTGSTWEQVKILDAFTWSQTCQGGSRLLTLQPVLTDAVNGLLDLFINDYLAANPKDSN